MHSKKLECREPDEVDQEAHSRNARFETPKFKVTDEFSEEQFGTNGNARRVRSEKANFSGMASREQLFISAVVHKAFVEVNEKKHRSGGGDGRGDRGAIAGPRHVPFHADHPFIFLIRDRRSGSILFLGRVANPVSSPRNRTQRECRR